MDPFEIAKYLEIAARRKLWIIIPFLIVALCGFAYSLITPSLYKAETLILIQAQKVPEDFVRSIVSSDIDTRLRTIEQQVTSRTNLEKIIREHNLDRQSTGLLGMEEKVNQIRNRIEINVNREEGARLGQVTAFTIAFEGENPRQVMEVTNALASNFISENLRVRESQALGTSDFLADELQSLERRLLEKEEKLKKYREKYMGGLPEQLDTNLRILERLQSQLDQLNANLGDSENSKILVAQAIEREKSAHMNLGSLESGKEGETRDVESLKNQLISLKAKYTEKHPDVIRVEKMIDQLELKLSDVELEQKNYKHKGSATNAILKDQLSDIEFKISILKKEAEKVKSQIKWYQARVEETPKREQELLSLQRDYSNLQELHNSVLTRKLEAEMAVSMEKKQKGEQFRIIDPAKIPSKPYKPDFGKITAICLTLGLGLGCGLAFLVEVMDTSYKIPEEAEEDLQLPVLLSMPIQYTLPEIAAIKRKKILTVASISAAFVLSAVGIALTVKGFDSTVSFIKGIFTEM